MHIMHNLLAEWQLFVEAIGAKEIRRAKWDWKTKGNERRVIVPNCCCIKAILLLLSRFNLAFLPRSNAPEPLRAMRHSALVQLSTGCLHRAISLVHRHPPSVSLILLVDRVQAYRFPLVGNHIPLPVTILLLISTCVVCFLCSR